MTSGQGRGEGSGVGRDRSLRAFSGDPSTAEVDGSPQNGFWACLLSQHDDRHAENDYSLLPSPRP